MNKKLPFVSVVIPTFNRSQILKKCLGCFLKQDYPESKTEIVVIDDGSSDNTKKMVGKLKKNQPKNLPLTYLFQKNRGPAAARNLAIKNCRGSIVIIVNDDILPQKKFIDQHVKFHLRYSQKNYAVLGLTTWSPEIKITPFMSWLETKGPLFSYNQLKGVKANWRHGWTCNISYKKDFLLNNGLFDEDFPYAAWEDIELAYRLYQRGMRLRYNKKAIAYHYHPTTLASSIKKMRNQGISVVILGKKIKDKSILPPLATKDIGSLIDILDRILANPPIVFLIRKVAFFCEPRFRCHFIYDPLLLHYRAIARREFIKKHAQKLN